MKSLPIREVLPNFEAWRLKARQTAKSGHEIEQMIIDSYIDIPIGRILALSHRRPMSGALTDTNGGSENGDHVNGDRPEEQC
jgi:hypothetical protein